MFFVTDLHSERAPIMVSRLSRKWSCRPFESSSTLVEPMPFDSLLFPGSFELLVPLFENHLLSVDQFIRRGDEADRDVEPDGIVMRDILCHKPPSIV
jgi:hypothetical protein